MDFGFWSLDFGFWILDFGFWILDLGFWILDFGFWILDFGFWILDFGVWILDFGFWISLVFVLFAAAPNGAVWILDFGFWSLDFGFWILDLGFWILDFGLDEASTDIVWILHKIFPCHADSGRRILQGESSLTTTGSSKKYVLEVKPMIQVLTLEFISPWLVVLYGGL